MLWQTRRIKYRWAQQSETMLREASSDIQKEPHRDKKERKQQKVKVKIKEKGKEKGHPSTK